MLKAILIKIWETTQVVYVVVAIYFLICVVFSY